MIQDIDANGKIPNGYGVCTDSLQVAKLFKKRHVEIIKIIEQLEKELNDKEWLFKSLFESVVFIKKQMEYRGQKYFVYGMSEKEYWLVRTRIKGKEALRDIIILINELFLTRGKAEEGKFYKDTFNDYMLFQSMKNDNKQEKDFNTEISLNFKKIFPNYEYISSEYSLPDGDRVDIFAKEKFTKRDVIMEIKVNPKSAHKQLRAYAHYFDNPILVNITRGEVKNKREGILYINIPNLKQEIITT